MDIREEFIKLPEKPRYGFGANMNPCIAISYRSIPGGEADIAAEPLVDESLGDLRI